MQNLKILYACLFVVICSIGAGVLGIEADRALHKGDHNCPPDSVGNAYKLGIASTVLMGMTLAIGTGIVKRPRLQSMTDSARSSTTMKVAFVTFLLTWGITITSAILLGIGLSADDPKTRVPCSFAKYHLLLVGGALCFVDAVIVAIYLVSCSLATAEGDSK